jgi:hypothetical protein
MSAIIILVIIAMLILSYAIFIDHYASKANREDFSASMLASVRWERLLKIRQKQHEDDLNGVIANLETGQTAEEVEFGIFPKSKQVNKKVKDDDSKVESRFELLDL